MHPYLKTERLTLRQLTLADEDHLFELDSDPEVMKYLTGGKPSSREDLRAAILRTQGLYEKHGGRFGFWAAIENSSNQFMGWLHFRPSKKDLENVKRIELGYRLKKVFWGKGIATEGGLALIAKGFGELGIDEVFAVASKINLGSRRVMEKCGLVYVREFDNPDAPAALNPEVEYALTKQRYLAAYPALR